MGIRRATGCALALVGAAGLSACGQDSDHANRERPPASINVTAAIGEGRIHVSPRRFGAGPIRLIVSNQTASAQALTFATAGDESGVTPTTAPINPSGPATLEVDVSEGDYAITASGGEAGEDERRARGHDRAGRRQGRRGPAVGAEHAAAALAAVSRTPHGGQPLGNAEASFMVGVGGR